MRASLLLVAACLAVAMGVAGAAERCSAEDGPASCSVCEAGGDSNLIHAVPRISSANLGDYEVVKWNSQTEQFDPVDPEPGMNKTIATYFMSIFLFSVLAWLIAFLCIPCGCFVLCCKHCCNCGCCGKRHPTKRRGEKGCCSRIFFCCCGLGFDERNDGTTEYSVQSRWCTRLFLFVFLICSLVFIGLGLSRGNGGVSPAMKAVAQAPQPVVDLMVGITDRPVNVFLRDLASDSIVGFVRDVNATVQGAVNTAELRDNLQCLLDAIDPVLDLSVVRTWLVAANTTVVSIISVADRVPTVIADINTQRTDSKNGLDSIDTEVNRVVAIVRDDVKPAMLQTQTTLTALTTFTSSLSTHLTSTQTDLTGLTDTQTARDSAADGGTASLDRLKGAHLTGASSTERDSLVTKLNDIKATFQGMPDFSATATNMQNTNTLISNAHRDDTIGDVERCLARMDTAFGTIPTFVSVNTTVYNGAAPLFAFTLSGVLSVLDDAKLALDGRPNPAPLKAKLQEVRAAKAALPCAFSMWASVEAVNETIFALDMLAGMPNVAVLLNDTLGAQVDQVTQYEGNVDSLETTAASVDTVSQRAEVVALEAVIQSSLADVDLDGVLSNFQSATAALNIDFSSFQSQMGSMNSTLNSNSASAGDLSLLNSFQTAKTTMITTLTDTVTLINKYAGGYCSISLTDCPCGGGDGTCTGQGTNRCTAVPSTACTVDSDCSGGDVCLIDTSTNGRMDTLITALKDTNLSPDVSAVATSVGDALAAINVASNQASLTASMTTGLTQIDTVVASTASFTSTISTVKGSMDSSFDDSAVTSSFSGAKNSAEAVPIGTFIDTIDQVQEQLNNQKPQLDLLETVKDLVASVETMLNAEMPGQLARLEKPALQAQLDSGGMSAMITHIATVADDIIFIANASLSSSNITVNDMDLVGESADIVKLTDVVSDKKFRSHGPAHFFASMSSANGGDKPIDPDDPKANRVWVDSDGNDYPDGRMCLSTACIDAEVDYLGTAPISELSDNAVPIPFSRTALLGTPFLMPGVLAFLAFLAILCGCSGGCCAKFSAGCLVGWAWVFLIPMLLFSGLLIPFPLLIGDFCYGAENVGYNIIEMRGDALCEQLGGVGGLANCEIEQQNVTVRLDVLNIYVGLFGQGGCPADNDPIGDMFDTMRSSVAGDVTQMIRDTARDAYPDSLKQPLRDDVDRFITSLSTNLQTFVGGLKEEITCDSLHSIYAGFKSAVCCETLSAVWWLIASLYILAWMACCCAVPAGLYGRKRLGKPWGPEAKGSGRRRAVIPVPTKLQAAPVDYQQNIPMQPYTQQPPMFPGQMVGAQPRFSGQAGSFSPRSFAAAQQQQTAQVW